MGVLNHFREELKYEILGIIMIALGVLAAFSLLAPTSGLLNEFVDRLLRSIAGEGRYLFPLLLVLSGVGFVRRRGKPSFSERICGIIISFLIILTFMHLIIPLEDSFSAGLSGDGGGMLGAVFSYAFRKSFGLAGTYIILVSASLVALLLLTKLSLATMIKSIISRARIIITNITSVITNFLFIEVEEGNKKNTIPVIVDNGFEERIIPGYGDNNNNSFEDDNLEFCHPSINQKARKEINDELANDIGDLGEESERAKEEASTETIDYKLPPITLLARPYRAKGIRNNKDINDNIRILEDTLESFGVKAKVTEVSRGPAITRYEIQPPAGIKVSRIVSLADDIALSMAAPGVRIEAPIPGKAAVGIEVPNKEISMVSLRELLETKEFIKSESNLTIALGKDITGNPVVADLTKMPHLLIAGATGSGKSVCLNTLIASILFKATPDEVKLLIIDPKVVELSSYNGIPHLASPVVTDPKKSATALRWAVKEMERRYEIFANAGVRDISRFNKVAFSDKGNILPYIVVIIDELADLMMIAPADVEDAVCRLAQMARAAGIHLVVATQRPSVDVITGLIKANITSRISFAVSSQVDSRTILDMGGAEKLLGKGDMLFISAGASKPVRIQGAYLSDRELDDLVNYLRKQAKPIYSDKIVLESDKEDKPIEIEDELLPQAVKILIETGHASISMLQRRLHIGYARAARLIDIMEKRGMVGGYEGSKPRSILMTMEQYNQVFKKT